MIDDIELFRTRCELITCLGLLYLVLLAAI